MLSVAPFALLASLPGNGERGLKHLVQLRAGRVDGFAPRQRGARIETAFVIDWIFGGLASLPGNGERGLKQFTPLTQASVPRFAPRQRGARIET